MSSMSAASSLKEVAARIREMRGITGYSVKQMAAMAEVTEEQYAAVEAAEADPSFSFLHKCAEAFGVDITALLEGHSAKLSGYVVTRGGDCPITAKSPGVEIRNMASMFKGRLATPYFVTYDYDASQQNKPLETHTHAGQEFDYVVSGHLKVRVGEHEETLNPGDSIFYKSSVPHGEIAVGGEKCVFIAMIMAGVSEGEEPVGVRSGKTKDTEAASSAPGAPAAERLVAERYVETQEDERGRLMHVSFKNTGHFNFAFDIVDEIAKRDPERLAMLHVSDHFTERRFTYRDMMEKSNRSANYFAALGIKRGDKVMLVMKRHFQFWPSILALHKLGAVVIPATNQLKAHDFEYRFKAGDVKAIVCSADGDVSDEVDKVLSARSPDIFTGMAKILVNGDKPGWRNYDKEVEAYPKEFERKADAPGGDEPMLMFFTSGTTSYPKMALHSYKYALGHFVTAKYWHKVERGGLHYTISETGWGKALWGKLYGQWLCEGAVFTYDFSKFDSAKILPMFAKYKITTFCAPPTMYRMLIKEDISKYDFSSVKHATTAGEALNPEVFTQFEKATGLRIHEGFGQTEMTLGIANLTGELLKPGAMGKPVPDYHIDLVNENGESVPPGEHGEIVIRLGRGSGQPGIFLGYYKDEERTKEAWRGGMYHTGDLAWKDEDGYFNYVGRADDVIKSSGYRIGPAGIENVIMELPYVLECGVSAAPDPVRGQVVKASIVLVKGKVGTDALKKEVQNYVKEHTAPYKYPRIVEFRESLPKTISGKIQRNQL